jgi:hypothetical protein
MNLGIERRNEIMAANVETMFSVREKPWHGLISRRIRYSNCKGCRWAFSPAVTF